MEGEMERLPEGCIANVISLTSPRDACRLSVVSRMFKSAAESDAVWERFLPPDYQSIISNSEPSFSSSASASASASALRFSSKKELFLSLCQKPILIDGGKKGFLLDKLSGKKCYMISARDLVIVWGDTPAYWRWTSMPESRFPEVAELICVCWLEIHGRISTRLLSTGTLYTAYLVFKSAPGYHGFEYQPLEVSVGLIGSEGHQQNVYLDVENRQRRRSQFPRRAGLFARSRSWGWTSIPRENAHYPKKREDDWMEVELGDFFNKGEEEAELEISVLETKGGNWKVGLIVQGIELRPKHGK